MIQKRVVASCIRELSRRASNIFQVEIILYIFLGVTLGIFIGALPGLSATMGVTLMLPFTFSLETTPGILLLLGVYIGAIYGGSVSAILLNTPGTPASAATVLDGYAMSKRGEGARALKMGTIASFIGGIISCIVLILVAPQLSQIALKFSSPEFFMLTIFGLSIISSISGKSLAKGLLSGSLGLFLSTIGLDRITGVPRFTYNSINLLSGISYIPVMIGLFAFSEMLNSIDAFSMKNGASISLKKCRLQKKDWKILFLRGPFSGLIGTFIGIIPGAGADIGAFISYNEAKRFSKNPGSFGKGVPEGVVAAEAANNGVTGGALIPMLTLGIPGDAVAAIMIGALTIKGLQPGPLLFSENPVLVYSIFLGLIIANIAMLIVGLSSTAMFSRVLLVPKHILIAAIFTLCITGSYAINSNLFDVLVMLIFGVLGYLMNKMAIPISPAVLGLILGSLAESHFRRSLLISEGSFSVFFTSPISLFFLIMTIVTLFWPLLCGHQSKAQ